MRHISLKYLLIIISINCPSINRRPPRTFVDNSKRAMGEGKPLGTTTPINTFLHTYIHTSIYISSHQRLKFDTVPVPHKTGNILSSLLLLYSQFFPFHLYYIYFPYIHQIKISLTLNKFPYMSTTFSTLFSFYFHLLHQSFI